MAIMSSMMKQLQLVVALILCLSLIDFSVQDGASYDKRPEFFPIYPQKMDVQYEAGFKHTYASLLFYSLVNSLQVT